jgi:hypothetical protein
LGKDCWSKPKKGKAHVAQTEEEESMLFLVSAAINTPFIPNQQDGDIGNHSPAHGVFTDAVEELSPGASLDTSIEWVELSEDKVFLRRSERTMTTTIDDGSSTLEPQTT